VRNRKQPGIELRACVVASDFAQYVQPCLLIEIVGRRGFADEPDQVPIEPVLIARRRIGQRRRFPPSQARRLVRFRH
jgi:hypothetical protein